MKHVLIFSPHLDDAVLSCSAKILQRKQAGDQITVVTVFTETSDASKQTHYLQRKKDDFRAMQILGADALHLGFTDAPFRSERYQNFSTLLFHHKLPLEEMPILEKLTCRLQEIIKVYHADELFFPLGVGGHIDHHLLFESAQSFSLNGIKVNYYEDHPYTLLLDWNAIRMHQINAVQIGEPYSIKKTSLVNAPFPFVHNYMASDEDRLRSNDLYDMEWSKIPSQKSMSTVMKIGDGCFSQQQCPISEALNKKWAAICCYSTEWQTLLGPNEAQAREWINHPETYWSPICHK